VLTITNRLHASIFTLLSDGALLVVDDGSDKMRALCRDFGIPSIRISGPPDAAVIAKTLTAALNFDRKARKKAMVRIARRAQGNLLALGGHAGTQRSTDLVWSRRKARLPRAKRLSLAIQLAVSGLMPHIIRPFMSLTKSRCPWPPRPRNSMLPPSR
jgi:tRNA(Ile)-lysidine synthase TilS/MesJ